MVKGFRKFYKNNRIYCILMLISIICILVLGVGVITYFVNQNTGNPYGKRLVEVDDHKLTDEEKKMTAYFKENESVKNTTIRLQGKIIYITVHFTDETTLETMQNIATGCLEILGQENLDFYDLQFLFTRDSYPAYAGSKSKAMQTISWANYNIDSEETTTTTTKKK